VLDLACGSGSFLIRAYDALLGWEAELAGMPMEQLTQEYRMPVLRRNIFGVDLDPQAIEIARLNLLLRALRERQRLPELRDNIKRGNSLVSGGEAELRPFFADGWREKQPFEWEREFPEIMKAGGFDVVIGNPPYVRVDTIPNDEKRYYKQVYQTCVGKYDLYYLFFEKAISLVREGGFLAFITPNRFCTNSTGEKLRELLTSQGAEVQVTSVSQLPVFEDAANYPVITIVHKTASQPKRLIHASPEDVLDLLSGRPSYELTDRDMAALPRGIIPINCTERDIRLAVTVRKRAVPAKEFMKFHEGLRIPATYEQRRERGSAEIPIIKQFQFTRYSPVDEGAYLSTKNFKLLFPREPERVRACNSKKLVLAEDALRVEATLDASRGLCQGGVYFGVLVADDRYDIRYLLGLLNSKLISFVYKAFYSGIHMGGGYLRFRSEYLQELPIKRIAWGKPEEKRQHDRVVGLVEEMLALQERVAPLRNVPSEERAELERHIVQVDWAIDEAVYELYGLTDAERLLVERET
jgi:SAM-dependent methyltransferase